LLILSFCVNIYFMFIENGREFAPTSVPSPEIGEAFLPAETEPVDGDRHRLRLSGTAVLTQVLSWDYIPAIGLGKAIEYGGGVNGWVAGGIVAAGTAVESASASYLVTKSLGDHQYTPKTAIGKLVSKASPLVSAWRGAPSGVAIDAASGKKITVPRRLAHGVVWGTCVGAWVTPLPAKAAEFVADYSTEAAGAGIATGTAAVVLKHFFKKRHTFQQNG
jgi:hypothetical protein